MNRPVVYEPSIRRKGWVYFRLGRLLVILYQNAVPQPYAPEAVAARLDTVKGLIDHCLTYEPTGLELRNKYILPIRENLQEWKTSHTLASMVKFLLTTVLDDSIIDKEGNYKDGGINPEKLTLNTLVAYDPSKQLHRRMEN